MDWTIQDYGALGELIGSIGVIATLVYVAIQIRQNGKLVDNSLRATRAQNLSTITARYNAVSWAALQVDDGQSMLAKLEHAQSIDELDLAEQAVLSNYLWGMLLTAQDGWLFRQLDVLPREVADTDFEFVSNSFLALPVVQAWYEAQRDLGAFSPGFRRTVDQAIERHRNRTDSPSAPESDPT